MTKPGHPDEILALLCGGLPLNPPSREARLAGVFLGTSLGALVDLGRTDAQILALCGRVIRAALADPGALHAFATAQSAIRDAGDK